MDTWTCHSGSCSEATRWLSGVPLLCAVLGLLVAIHVDRLILVTIQAPRVVLIMLIEFICPILWRALYLRNQHITSQTHLQREATRIFEPNLDRNAEVGPRPGEANGESVSIAGHHTTAERDDTLWPGVGP